MHIKTIQSYCKVFGLKFVQTTTFSHEAIPNDYLELAMTINLGHCLPDRNAQGLNACRDSNVVCNALSASQPFNPLQCMCRFDTQCECHASVLCTL